MDAFAQVLAVIISQAIGYAALGRKLNAIKSDLDALKKHNGIEVVDGKVLELRPVMGREYTK